MRRYNIVLTKVAESDLDQIINFLEQNTPDYARQLSIALRDSIESLGYLPESDVPVAASRKRGFVIRHLLVDSHMIYYRIEAQTVFITRIRHGARRPLKRFD